MKIGFAGLGSMGSRLASCLVGVGDQYYHAYTANLPEVRPGS